MADGRIHLLANYDPDEESTAEQTRILLETLSSVDPSYWRTYADDGPVELIHALLPDGRLGLLHVPAGNATDAGSTISSLSIAEPSPSTELVTTLSIEIMGLRIRTDPFHSEDVTACLSRIRVIDHAALDTMGFPHPRMDGQSALDRICLQIGASLFPELPEAARTHCGTLWITRRSGDLCWTAQHMSLSEDREEHALGEDPAIRARLPSILSLRTFDGDSSCNLSATIPYGDMPTFELDPIACMKAVTSLRDMVIRYGSC